MEIETFECPKCHSILDKEEQKDGCLRCEKSEYDAYLEMKSQKEREGIEDTRAYGDHLQDWDL